MIPSEEVKEIAVRYSIPTSSVERDYAQGWLLASLTNKLDMAFKGGTCIKKIYLEDYRFSDDLDFTLLREYSESEINEKIVESVQEAKAESGVAFEDSVLLKQVSNGFRGAVGFRLLRTVGSPIKITLDFT